MVVSFLSQIIAFPTIGNDPNFEYWLPKEKIEGFLKKETEREASGEESCSHPSSFCMWLKNFNSLLF